MPIVSEGADIPGNRIVVATVAHAPESANVSREALGDEGYAIKTVGDDLYMIGARRPKLPLRGLQLPAG